MSGANECRWAVVGGGMLGMTLALRLSQQGQRVTLFEASDHLGGLADAWRVGDVVWDRHYHVTLLSDGYLRALLKELELESDMRWAETKTGFYTNGQLHSMSNTIEFLRFAPLKFADKLRLGLTILYCSKIRDWRRLEKIPVTDWLRRLSGKQTYETIWLPLLRAKLGENHEQTSAAFIWATIARMYSARRSGLKKEMFGYVSGGYSRIIGRFEQHLRSRRVDIQVGCPVMQVHHDSGKRIVRLRQSAQDFDRVVITTPASAAARMCPQLAAHERDLLEKVRYQGILCASLLLQRPLGPFYVTNITDSSVPFTGVIEMTNLVDRGMFGGRSLVYLPKYLPSQSEEFERSDAEIQEEFVRCLDRMYPSFQRRDLLAFRLSRVRNVCALSTIDYSKRVPPTRTTIPGVYIATSAQIVNGTLNVNETVKLAEDSVAALLEPIEHQREYDHSEVPQSTSQCEFIA